MPYPVLTIERAQELVALLRPEVDSLKTGGDPFAVGDSESDWTLTRDGADYPRSLVEKCAVALKNETIKVLETSGPPTPSDAYQLEAKMAGPLHDVLSQCGMDMLEDEDFWRYLALFPFRWFLIAREPELQPQDFGGYSEVEEEGRTRRVRKPLITQLIYRTYLWGKIAHDDEAKDKYQRATVIGDLGGPLIDVWHSHLIRTQLGQLGLMPHSFIDVLVSDLDDPSKMKDPAREVEKLIKRVKHNVLFDVYEKSDADSIVREQLSKVV
jgi:hypothetical protein